MIINYNENGPHVAVIWLEAHIYEKLPGGELSGKPVWKNNERGQKLVLQVTGENKQRCHDKITEILQELKDKCK